MRGDYSRLRFQPRDHYSAVRMQQGRVHLDAEWNEQVDIEAHRDKMTALDVIGPHGVPYEGGGFAIGSGAGLRGISFPASGQGWAVGEEATLIPSADLGATWNAPATPPAGVGALNAVHMVADGVGWAVGDGGAILRLAGGSWTSTPAGAVTGDLLGLHFTAADEGWVVGERGTIVRRSASSWTTQVPQEVTGALRDVAALSATRAFAVGDGGAIVATSDGGANWAVQAVDAEIGTLYAVTAMLVGGVERAWAVGAGGVIVTLQAGDPKWKRQSTPRDLTATLRGVAFFDGGTGFAVGDDGTVLKTNNGGANWNRQAVPSGFVAHLRSVAFAGDKPVAAGDNVVLRPGQSPALASLSGAARSLTISAGDAYVGGVRCVNERDTTFAAQPGYPGARLPVPATGGTKTYGVYLHRAEHHVTATERDDLREVALGGPDTTTRTETVWQVRLTDELSADTCAALEAEIAAPAAGQRGLLRARSTPSEQATSECIVAPGGGYRRLENQLYRVEILGEETDQQGNVATAFTWSRENGSVAARLLGIDAQKKALTFEELDRDEALGIGPGHWVELTDESRALRAQRGVLAEVKTVRGNVLEVVDWPDGAAPAMRDFPTRPIVRRWEGKGKAETGKWIELEDGVEIEFATGTLEPGDYWTIPARTLLGNVDWPRNGSTAVFEQRAETGAGDAPLAIVRRLEGGTWEVARDCRRLFPSLTGLVHFYYVGGDGQEAEPDLIAQPPPLVALDKDLQVGVSNWRWPVEGARVRFRRVSGGGAIAGRGANVQIVAPNENVIVRTDPQGIAACGWSIDAVNDNQVVEATLLDEQDRAMQTPIRFGANRSIAARVAYAPGAGCTALAGVTDVQGALERVTGAIRLHHVAGQAAHGLPGTAVQLQAGLSSGCVGQASGRVLFERRPNANGNVNTAQPVNAQSGVATCTYTLGSNATQEITATLVDGQGQAIATTPPIVFTLSVTRAQEVTFNPAACPGMQAADTVQEALEALCQRGQMCTVDVGPGDDLEAAFKVLKERGGGELCLSAGTWELDGPIEVEGLSRVVVSGRGPASVIRCSKSSDALVFLRCDNVTVRYIRVEAFAAETPKGVRGALSFFGTNDIRVVDCELRCGERADGVQACIVVAGDGEERPEVNRVEIERNRFEIGSFQTGALVLDAQRSTIARNYARLEPQGAFDEDPLPSPPDSLTGGLVRELGSSLVAGRLGVTAGTEADVVDVHGTTMTFPRNSPLVDLMRDFAGRFPQPEPGATLEDMLKRYLARVAEGEISDEMRVRLVDALQLLASAGRGFLVAGRVARTVQIFDNVVEDVIQGIGVAVSNAETPELERAGDVVLSRNVVRCQVPNTWRGQRNAVFVGSADTVMIKDTVASLARTGDTGEPEPAPVDAIRVSGALGHFLSVSQSSLRGFDVGVRVDPDLEQAPELRMWLVSETVAADGGQAVVVPPDWVEVVRSVP